MSETKVFALTGSVSHPPDCVVDRGEGSFIRLDQMCLDVVLLCFLFPSLQRTTIGSFARPPCYRLPEGWGRRSVDAG